MSKYWVKKKCKMCGKKFEVRACYAKRGQGKFCSTSCGVRYRNLHNNSSWRPEVRAKISRNHADVSGTNNPMYGRRGRSAPSYVDGRNSFTGDIWRKIVFANNKFKGKCEICDKKILRPEDLEVHHIDGNRKNNNLSNLQCTCSKCHQVDIHPKVRDKRTGRFVRSA